MSLRVWLPLNGTLDSLGTDEVTLTNHGATVNSNGKIGTCYLFDGTNDYITTIDTAYPEIFSGDFSLCFWIYSSADGSRDIYFGNYGISGSGNWFNIERDTSNRLRFWWNNGAIDKRFTTFSIISSDDWTHIAFVRKGNSVRVYKNSSFMEEYTTTISNSIPSTAKTFNIGGDYRTSGDLVFGGKMNDFRVYDHALSEKEIHDISKALVLHYPLDDNGYDRSNDMPNSIDMALGSANAKLGIWRNAGSSTMTRSRVLINDSPIGACYGFQNSGIQTPNDGSCYGIDSFPTDSNTDYVISLWARITDGTEGYAGFNIYSSSMLDGFEKVDKNYRVTRLPSDGSWKRVYCHFKTNANGKRNIYIGVTTGSSNVTTQMCAVKLEKGTMPTMWSPAPSDIVSYESSDILDTSGFHNNGTSNSVSIVVDSPRYCAATNLKSTKQIINALVPTFISNGSCTFWAKVVENGSIGWIPVCDSSSTSRYLMASKSDGSNSYNGGLSHTAIYYEDGAVVKKPTFDGLWHHYAITNISFSASWDSLRIGSTHAGWSGDVSYSDFRLYSTVLTPENIKELYEVGASIDNLQNMHTHLYIEDPTYSNPSITKTGIVKENELEEADKASLFSSGKVTAKEIIEI